MKILACGLRAVLLTSSATLAFPVIAQELSSLPSVTINTSGGPANIATAPLTNERLSREILTLRQSMSSDTGGLLARLPGVSANTGGGFSSMPAIRGLSEQRLKILVDGHAIDPACPNDMNSPLSYTDPQTIARIDVVTGVSPVSMGGDSIGGVINVESARPQFAGKGETLLTGNASTFYRSNGNGFGGAVSLTAAGQHVSATYTGSYTQSDNYDGGGNKAVVRSTEFAKTDHALALAVLNSTGLFELKGGYHFSPYEGFPNQYMDMTSNKSWFLNGRWRGTFTWGSVDWLADYRDTDHEMNFLADKGGEANGGMPMNTEVHTASTSVKLDLPVSRRDTIRIGGEYHHQWLDDYWPAVAGSMMMGPNAYVNINAAHRDRIGLFGEWEAHWSTRLSTLAGLRYDHVAMNTGQVQPYGTGMMNMDDATAATAFNAVPHGRNDDNWSGSILLSYAATSSVRLELGYAHKVRSPNIYERFSWGRGPMSSRMIGWYGDGNGYVGYLNLKPERADTLSAAVAVSGESWSLKAAPYYTHVSDYIDAVYLQSFKDMMGMPTAFVQLQFANQEAEFYGIDVSGSLALWTGELGNGTRLTGSLSYVRGQNLGDHGALYHQMPLDVKLGLDHRQGAFEVGLDFDLVKDKQRIDATRNEPRTKGYALVGLRAAYTIKAVRLSIAAENLLDEGYDLPLGGISLGDNKATGVRRPVPGRGRSINIGLSTSF